MGSMSASDAAPLPRLGEVFFDVRGSSRSMRLSWYSDTGVAVFSIWQGGTCTGTFRLPLDDLPRMVEALQRGPRGAALPAADGRDLTGDRPRRGIAGVPADPAVTSVGGFPDYTTGQQIAPPVTGEFRSLGPGDSSAGFPGYGDARNTAVNRQLSQQPSPAASLPGADSRSGAPSRDGRRAVLRRGSARIGVLPGLPGSGGAGGVVPRVRRRRAAPAVRLPRPQPAVLPRRPPGWRQCALLPRRPPGWGQCALLPRRPPGWGQCALLPRRPPGWRQRALLPRRPPGWRQLPGSPVRPAAPAGRPEPAGARQRLPRGIAARLPRRRPVLRRGSARIGVLPGLPGSGGAGGVVPRVRRRRAAPAVRLPRPQPAVLPRRPPGWRQLPGSPVRPAAPAGRPEPAGARQRLPRGIAARLPRRRAVLRRRPARIGVLPGLPRP